MIALSTVPLPDTVLFACYVFLGFFFLGFSAFSAFSAFSSSSFLLSNNFIPRLRKLLTLPKQYFLVVLLGAALAAGSSAVGSLPA